jgi:PAS domain S-box-containing protein
MYDLRSFGLSDLLECSSRLRRVGTEAASLEEAAQAVVEFLFQTLVDKETDRPALALARLYKTHRLDELEPELQTVARERAGDDGLPGDTPCLTLLGTAGTEAAWNDRRRSRDHKAIPLHDSAALASAPMVFELTRQLGFDEDAILEPDPAIFQTTGGRAGGVFFVPEATASPHIPAQGFVERFGIRSVIGFGGALPSGYVFAVILFATVALDATSAESFAPLAFATELALLPFVENRLFSTDATARPRPGRDLRQAQAEAAALNRLLETRHHVVVEQAARLEQARQEAEDRADALARAQARVERSEATKAAILDAALDAIITIDINGDVVDFSPAAEQIFGYPRSAAIGQPLAELIIPPELREAHRSGIDRFRQTGIGPILGRRVEVTALRADGTEIPVELAIAAIDAAGTPLFSAHVRDITDRLEAERALRAAGERYAEIARILQSSLLPPELPLVPRFEIASRYRPGQDGLDVGGDFYDVFSISGGSWGVILGDVMGKGAAAAATTALERHTARAAALGADNPLHVLRLLNEALHRDSPDRFCTAVIAFLHEDGRARVAAGGHPAPLVRRRSGAIETLPCGGALLGPFPQWDGRTCELQLDAGDLLLLFSDGVIEARRHREEFGSERLGELLAAAPTDAEGTLDAVMDALSAFATSEPDDIALVALRYSP